MLRNYSSTWMILGTHPQRTKCSIALVVSCSGSDQLGSWSYERQDLFCHCFSYLIPEAEMFLFLSSNILSKQNFLTQLKLFRQVLDPCKYPMDLECTLQKSQLLIH
jgi:hypothetical protein